MQEKDHDSRLPHLGADAETPRVFISYSHADSLTALAIDQWLRSKGARVLIDQHDFVPGNFIEDEMVRCIQDAGKVVCIYSQSSSTRPYPLLERRIASQLEIDHGARRLIFLCIDATPLPLEARPRLAILAQDLAFEEACELLWNAILEQGALPRELDLTQFRDTPPWRLLNPEATFDLLYDSDNWDHLYKNR